MLWAEQESSKIISTATVSWLLWEIDDFNFLYENECEYLAYCNEIYLRLIQISGVAN